MAARAPSDALFQEVSRVRWPVLVLFVVLHTVLLLLFFTEAFHRAVSAPLFAATEGLITHTLLTNLLELVILIVGVVFLLGGLRPRDVGLVRTDVVNALVVMVLLWALVQLATVLIGWTDGGALTFNPSLWEHEGPARLGRPLEATFGSGLVEEVTYRGFLLPQLYLMAGRWWPPSLPKRLAFAVIVTQLFFGINHIPAGLAMDMPAGTLLLWITHVSLVGAFFAAIYLRTANLFVAIGVHALINNPLSLLVSGTDPALLVLIVALILLILWPLLARSLDEVFTLRAALAQRWRHAHPRSNR